MEEEIQKEDILNSDENASAHESDTKEDPIENSEVNDCPVETQDDKDEIPKSSPEKEDPSTTSPKVEPATEFKVQEASIASLSPASKTAAPDGADVGLFPPSHGMSPPKTYKSLTVYPEAPRQFLQKRDHRITVERKRSRRVIFIVITVLLCLITISYLVGGTWLFLYLEEIQETTYIEDISKLKNDTAILLATELRQVKAHEAVWSRFVFKHLDKFEEILLKRTGIAYWRHGNANNNRRWAYPNTVFYSLSLMTSTGYGSMTPRSKWGRTATVCYSLFGIPLMISWIICMGHFFACYWFWMFDSICCRFCYLGSGQKNVTNHRPQSKKLLRRKSNSIAPMTEATNHAVELVATLKLEGTSSYANKELKNNSKNQEVLRAYEPLNLSLGTNSVEGARANVRYSDIDSKLNDMDHAVSIVFALIFFLVYFVFGSALFAVIESLQITDILYFNYLMFATLGPGCHELLDDLVENTIKGNLYYTIYLIFGYIILSMLFNLIYMYYYSASRNYRTLRKTNS